MTSSAENALERLEYERKLWRKTKMFGYSARPVKKEDGSLDLLNWVGVVPGTRLKCYPAETYVWSYNRITLEFSHDYPSLPPICKFDPVITHPNVDESGRICHREILPGAHWSPDKSLHDILEAIQSIFTEPELCSIVNAEQYLLHLVNPTLYFVQLCRQGNYSQGPTLPEEEPVNRGQQ